MVTPLLALPYEQTDEYRQKRAILNERAARFRAETGFEGSISFDFQNMKFSDISGSFRDLVVTAPQDTVNMSNVFDRVFTKVNPFITAQNGHFIKGSTTWNGNISLVRYEQVVNGYKVSGAGFITISYWSNTNRVTILDCTVDLPEVSAPINITLDQAIRIAIQRYDPNYNYIPDNVLSHPRSRLVYCQIPDDEGTAIYRLCYMISFWGLTLYIDPSSGEIVHTRTLIID